MKVRVRRFDKNLPLPEYKTSGAAGLDCVARETTVINPQEIVRVPLNVAVEIPEGYFILVAARGSLHKRGLFLGNGVGIGDCDFCGDNDEYKAVLFNFTNEPVTVERGDRIVQMVILPYETVEIEEVESLENADRGAFGSTGVKD